MGILSKLMIRAWSRRRNERFGGSATLISPLLTDNAEDNVLTGRLIQHQDSFREYALGDVWTSLLSCVTNLSVCLILCFALEKINHRFTHFSGAFLLNPVTTRFQENDCAQSGNCRNHRVKLAEHDCGFSFPTH